MSDMRHCQNMEAKELHEATRLHRAVRTEIGEKLRTWFDDVVKESIPAPQADLLRRLEDAERL
jgi:hypothetical protein